MNLVKNITSIIVNLSTLLWYGFTKLAIHVEEIIDTLWISSEGEHIKRDSYRVEEDETEWNRERNRYGFPREIKRRS